MRKSAEYRNIHAVPLLQNVNKKSRNTASLRCYIFNVVKQILGQTSDAPKNSGMKALRISRLLYSITLFLSIFEENVIKCILASLLGSIWIISIFLAAQILHD